MSYTKSIRVNKELFNKNEKKTKRNKTRRHLVSPDQIQSLLSKRKKTLKKSIVPKDKNLQSRQKRIHEQIMKANNFKDLYKQLYENNNENQDVNNIYNDLNQHDNLDQDEQDNINQDDNLDKDDNLYKQDNIDQDVSQNNTIYEEIVNVKKIDREPIIEKKVDFYAKSPKKNRKQRSNPKKTKISTNKKRSKTKSKKYSPELIDKYFLEINNKSNKKNTQTKKKKETIFKLIQILKKIIQSDNPKLISRFIKKLKRHHVINLLCIFGICLNKKTRAPLKILKFLLFVSAFDTIKIIRF